MSGNTPEQGEGGRWTESVTLDAVLDVFDAVVGPPVISSRDVANELDCSSDTARRKLRRLRDQGQVATRETGRTTIWWRTADFEEVSSDE